jgi:hypothetical protein
MAAALAHDFLGQIDHAAIVVDRVQFSFRLLLVS